MAWCSVAWYGTHGAPPDAGWASIDWVGALVATSVSRVQEERVAESAGAITRGHRDRRLKGRPASGRDLDSPKRWSWWLAWTTTSEKSSPSSATCSRRASSCSTGYGICHSTGTSSGRATSGAPLTSTRSCGSSNSSTGEWDKKERGKGKVGIRTERGKEIRRRVSRASSCRVYTGGSHGESSLDKGGRWRGRSHRSHAHRPPRHEVLSSDSVRMTASMDCALGVLSISSGKGRTSVHLRIGGKRNSGRQREMYNGIGRDTVHDPFTYALGPTMWREREWRESCARVNTVTRVRIVHACVPLRLRILIFTQASLGDKSIFRGLLNVLRMRT